MRFRSRYETRFLGICLALLFVLVAIVADSPWHVHKDQLNQSCAVCHFSHISIIETPVQFDLQPPLSLGWSELPLSSDLTIEWSGRFIAARAPPAS